jgi:F420-non-reducing hydrogenase small subunit
MVRVAEEWLATCGGCEVTILDIGEPLLELLPHLEFVHMPVLMDHKYFGQTGEKEFEIPEADVGLISGGIRNEENAKIAVEMRKKCNILVAVGSCANFGGIPALANMSTLPDLMDTVYRKTSSTEPADNPAEDVPELKDRVYAVSEVVKVDAGLPGCPTTPELMAHAITSLLEGKPITLAERSVCDECPTKREKKVVSSLKRPLDKIDFEPGQKYEDVRCLMEQGYLCLGPATRSGCGGDEKVPRCIRAYMPCRGCFGPIRAGANPMVDLMGAISSIGLDARQIEDRMATFNRFVGVTGRLRPLPGGR